WSSDVCSSDVSALKWNGIFLCRNAKLDKNEQRKRKRQRASFFQRCSAIDCSFFQGGNRMIKLRHINKIYQTKKNKVTAVDDVSLHIKSGEIYGIVGYSGAGKSTLLRCINLLERPTSGEIFIDGTDLTKLSSQDLRKARQSIGIIFQGFHLVSSKTAAENIAFSLKVAGVAEARRKARVRELLELVGLADKADQYPSQLSGGQKQRVSIARALANNPKVLL